MDCASIYITEELEDSLLGLTPSQFPCGSDLNVITLSSMSPSFQRRHPPPHQSQLPFRRTAPTGTPARQPSP